jgi:ATP-binding cassette subfamily C protein LapB
MNVGERGEGISGGQRQSIAIARAVISDVPIILLDEPTNMMDSLTEEKVKHNLIEVLGGKTVILVTHKTSLLDLVDRLMVVEEGKIVADGPKEDVLKKLAGGK